jgi:hypothetical protein
MFMKFNINPTETFQLQTLMAFLQKDFGSQISITAVGSHEVYL